MLLIITAEKKNRKLSQKFFLCAGFGTNAHRQFVAKSRVQTMIS